MLLGLPGAAQAGAIPTSQLHVPFGSGAVVVQGDYVSCSNGLDTYYSYFVEVPPGLSRFDIDIYDADIGLGGNAELNGPGDRQRGGSWDTSASYRLYDPSGTARATRFSTGDASSPAGAHLAWLPFARGTTDNVKDSFGTVSYGNQDGSGSWTTSWLETDAAGGSPPYSTGNIQVVGGELRITGAQNSNYIQRQVNLSAGGLELLSAWLRFGYRFTGNLQSSDCVRIQASANGGSTWTTLRTMCANAGSGTFDQQINAYISANTRIRFIVSSSLESGDYFYADDVEIYGVIPPGHWEVRIDHSSAVTLGDDVNGVSIRAHDGDPTPGGVELNIYGYSFSEFGTHTPDPVTFNNYPFLTSGCTLTVNTYDWDNAGSITYTSPTGSWSETVDCSGYGPDVWVSTVMSGFLDNVYAADYGIWTATATVSTLKQANYITIYGGNFQAANPPPTAQPEAYTYRTYMPRDSSNPEVGGGAPVKPYITQDYVWVSGPNPPQVGQATRVEVEVKVYDQTPFPITFQVAPYGGDSTLRVTASLPADARVRYVGSSATVTQGSVTQPAGGATSGNVSWNPLLVAAGAIPVLTYQLDVTPTAHPQTIPITRSPTAGNPVGTTAKFIDETCSGCDATHRCSGTSPYACTGAQLSRATHTDGPLCGLSIDTTETVPTLAAISSLAAREVEGGVLVRWETGAETGTAGFYLYRQDHAEEDYRLVNDRLLPGLIFSPQGGVYEYLDDAARPGVTASYQLLEIESRGGARAHGPVRVAGPGTVGGGPPSSPSPQSLLLPGTRFRRTPRVPSLPVAAASLGAVAGNAFAEDALLGGPVPSGTLPIAARPGFGVRGLASASPLGPRVRITIGESGLYRLELSEIAAALGMPLRDAWGLLRRQDLRLSNRGQPVPWLPAKDGSAILFFGEALDSVFSDHNVYWLEEGRGPLISELGGPGPSPVGDGASFVDTLHVESDRYPATELFDDPDGDYWLWEFFAATSSGDQKSFTVTAPGPAASGQATLAINLRGGSDTESAADHHLAVSLNGTRLGETRWNGTEATRLELGFDASLLGDGDNTVTLTAILDPGVAHSIFHLDSFDLSYPRFYRAHGDRLLLSGDGHPVVTVGGFSSSEIMVIEVSDPRRPSVLSAVTLEPGRVSFRPASPEARYLALAAPAESRPHAVAGVLLPHLRGGTLGADYLIIAPAALLAAAQPLADYRAGQGLRTMVVSVEEIVDVFNHGIYSPRALADFLAWTQSRWSRRPRYALLVGKGSIDYRDRLGAGGNLCPLAMTATPYGLFPSDSALADADGDHLPELALGRLPVGSAAELAGAIAKIRRYEAGAAGDWTSRLLFAADNPDEGGNFPADSDRLAAQLPPSFGVERIYLSTLTAAGARQRLLDGLDAGALLVSYLGHAALFGIGLDERSFETLLSTEDLPLLANGERLPVVLAATCLVNNFSFPGVDALGEGLLLWPDGGAIAVWAPTGWSTNAEAVALDEAALRLATADSPPPLGEIVLGALAEASARGVSGHTLDIYTLLGDPALVLRHYY